MDTLGGEQRGQKKNSTEYLQQLLVDDIQCLRLNTLCIKLGNNMVT